VSTHARGGVGHGQLRWQAAADMHVCRVLQARIAARWAWCRRRPLNNGQGMHAQGQSSGRAHLSTGTPRYFSVRNPPATVPKGRSLIPPVSQYSSMPLSTRRSSSENCTCAGRRRVEVIAACIRRSRARQGVRLHAAECSRPAPFGCTDTVGAQQRAHLV